MKIDILRDAEGRPTHLRIRVGDGTGLRGLFADAWSGLSRTIQRGTAAFVPAAAAATAAGAPTVVIEARPETFAGTLQAMWRYRSFYGLLFRENLMRRARGTLLGFWWVILRPLMAAAGFIGTFVFVAPMNMGSSIPYPIFFLSGFIPWRLFQATVTQLPRAVTRTRGMMSRTYFPRLLVPLAGFGQALIEVGILCAVFVMVVVAQWWLHPDQVTLRLGVQTLWLVPCLLGALAFAVAIGMVFGIVALFFRDVVFTVTYVVQLVMFVTPVLYPATFVPGSYRWVLYSLNPMAQIVTVSRWALTGQGDFQPFFVALAFATIAAVFAAAVVFFLRAERHLGDQL